jgi:hypothetical protein
MVSPASDLHALNPSNGVTLFNTRASGSVDSFAEQLETALEGFLGQSGSGSQFAVNIQDGQGRDSAGTRQFTVTVTDLAGSAPASTDPPVAAATTPVVSLAGSTPAAAVSTPVAAVSTPAASTSGAAATVPNKSSMTPTDAYWAEQPTAVQALRYMPDDQKYLAAQQLADQGYTIDVPIMVWGWDPLATMIERQSAGYTWVPSALQPSMESEPGVSMEGITPYNPNTPPPGSIQVSTAFADGTNMNDAVAQLWIQGQASTQGA